VSKEGVSEGAEWLAVCKLDDIIPKTAKHFDTALGGIGVFRFEDGRLFAIEDRCPHAFALLSFGLMDPGKESVMCPLHGWRIGLNDGEVHFPPHSGMSVCAYEVRVSAGMVEIRPKLKTTPATNMPESGADSGPG
jgi:nitrite reductase (NADH) small subunit